MKEINYLKKSHKIYLVAPSFGCTTEPYKTRLDAAITNLQEEGYDVIEGHNIYLNKGHVRSNSAKNCAKEFNEAYLNSNDGDAIISVGGGETMCEILPYINFKKIKQAPHRFFMGFSDNTCLTYTLTTLCEVKTIYGPCAGSFAFKPFEYSTKDALDLLTNKVNKTKGYPVWERYKDYEAITNNPLLSSNFSEDKIIKLYPKDSSFNLTGRLLGGCLDILIMLCGTKYDETSKYLEKYKEDGFIWFLESCDLNSLMIERGLFQLKEAGWFKYCKGFIFGRPLHFKEKILGVDHYSAIKTILKELKLPIAFDVDLGHFDPSMPVITGAKANVVIEKGNIFIKYLKE